MDIANIIIQGVTNGQDADHLGVQYRVTFLHIGGENNGGDPGGQLVFVPIGSSPRSIEKVVIDAVILLGAASSYGTLTPFIIAEKDIYFTPTIS